MNSHFNYNLFALHNRKGFTITEAIASVVVLAIIISGVLVVFNRCSESTLNSTLRMQAFEVARENMETLLISKKITNGTEYGYSEKYPAIEWTTTVETFTEPDTKSMWARAICSAQYEDLSDELKKVELVQWIAKIDDKQAKKIKGIQQKLNSLGKDSTDLFNNDYEADDIPEGLSPEDLQQMLEDAPEEMKPFIEQIIKMQEQSG